ncbi:MAG TPA: MarR family transcriptional regulator [Sphingomonas sp.]
MRWLELRVGVAIDRAVEAYIARLHAAERQRAAPRPALPRADARGILRARRARDRFLPGDLFGEPAWDMLLDLRNQAQIGADVSVSSLCYAAAVPPSTALRWIVRMAEAGLLERSADGDDGRRSFVRLSKATAEALDRYFGWLEANAS